MDVQARRDNFDRLPQLDDGPVCEQNLDIGASDSWQRRKSSTQQSRAFDDDRVRRDPIDEHDHPTLVVLGGAHVKVDASTLGDAHGP